MKYEITISTTIEVEADGTKKAKEKALEYDGKEDVHIDHIVPLATANTEEEVI